MYDTRVRLVRSLIEHTTSGKLKWEVGARSDQYYTSVPSGSIVLSKIGGLVAISEQFRTPITAGPPSPSEMQQGSQPKNVSAGAPTYSELPETNKISDFIYRLEIRDTEANVIDSITSQTWKWLPGASLEDGIEKLYELVQKSLNDVIEKQLRDIMNDLNAL